MPDSYFCESEWWSMREKLELPAVKDKELESILNKFNLCKPLEDGAIECYSCGKVINWENIGALKVSKDELVLFCNDPECIEVASD